ncbi:MAG TPA: tetratricopeptide repeat protein [Chthoniobacterales bacterium]|jgi:AAA+ superfamily predicted ATPase
MSQIDSLREAVRVSPDNVPLLVLFAETCLAELSVDEAVEAFQKVLAKEPQHAEARVGLARALHQAGRTSEAILRLEAFVEEQPGHAAAWLQLSRFLMAEGQRDAAVSCYEKSLKLPGGRQDASLEQELFLQNPEKTPARGRVTSEGWNLEAEGAAAPGIEPPVDDALERPATTFEDIGGMESVKEEIRMKILYPLKNPDLFKAYGKKAGGGVLLYGPPGCGKTLISRATAGEIDANFLSIGIHQILDLYIGESEKNLHRIFELARDNAPTILFFDEVDALAADRRDMRKSAGRTLINQFLAEMDGNVAENDGVLILGATNAPWHVDPAFRRPGRFDRILFVPPPDEAARASVIEVLAKGKPIANLDPRDLARRTKDFSGADLKAVFEIAIERSLAQAMKRGQVVPVTQRELVDAAKSLKPSTKAWFESAKNYALYSNQGGFYNDVLEFLGLKK